MTSLICFQLVYVAVLWPGSPYSSRSSLPSESTTSMIWTTSVVLSCSVITTPAALISSVLVVETTCNFQSLQDNPYWLCQSQDVDCSGYGCESVLLRCPNLPSPDHFRLHSCNAPANANGGCSAWLTARSSAGSATTSGSVAAPHFTQRTTRIADLVRLAVPFGVLFLVAAYDLISECCLRACGSDERGLTDHAVL